MPNMSLDDYAYFMTGQSKITSAVGNTEDNVVSLIQNQIYISVS